MTTLGILFGTFRPLSWVKALRSGEMQPRPILRGRVCVWDWAHHVGRPHALLTQRGVILFYFACLQAKLSPQLSCPRLKSNR